ncbi:hypothetical protein N7510_006594 [Penicillium lagena]|uniref:uncharacterized protein n=1 Tax=Penicillium lagena TaxID=94218 RepID=UPI002541C1ED|nr:uncharacterized protein N7510_006594 [Penicillium lagena]KAJ5613400.1 hypothetical protein N7510_006594 [Penicillium lagena]
MFGSLTSLISLFASVRIQLEIVLTAHRFVNAGFMGRSLCSQDFLPHDSLPCDTEAWDRGELAPSEPIFVTAATSVKTDSFGRLCQMGLLLGRILEHRDDQHTLNGVDRFENALQLNRTLRSLLSKVKKEFASGSSDYGLSVCLGFTAMVALHELYACTGTNRGTNTVQETEMQTISIKELKSLTAEIRSHLVQWLDKRLNLCDIGPLACNCIYQAAATSAWYARESGDSWMQESHGIFVNALEQIQPRWAVAGEEVRLLFLI